MLGVKLPGVFLVLVVDLLGVAVLLFLAVVSLVDKLGFLSFKYF